MTAEAISKTTQQTAIDMAPNPTTPYRTTTDAMINITEMTTYNLTTAMTA